MKLVFSENAWEEYLYWQKTDKKVLSRINDLLCDIQRNRYQGIGKPEPLRNNLAGWWSRRIDAEHRIVYKVETNSLFIAQVRYHY
jgi:toxin YoeB